jgi:RNA-directed DNA polymerase
MHFAFDAWMARRFPGCPFERFADDAVVHCATKTQAEEVLAAIAERMEQVGLRLHPDKTRIVYCKDGKRRGSHEHTSFTYLGFTFRARQARSKNGSYFTSFLPAMSTQALQAKSDELRKMRIHRRTTLTLDDLARWLNPIVGGWMNYYGRFYRSAMEPLLLRVNSYLKRWAGKKYRRLRTHKSFQRWWAGLVDRQPRLLVQWKWVRGYWPAV